MSTGWEGKRKKKKKTTRGTRFHSLPRHKQKWFIPKPSAASPHHRISLYKESTFLKHKVTLSTQEGGKKINPPSNPLNLCLAGILMSMAGWKWIISLCSDCISDRATGRRVWELLGPQQRPHTTLAPNSDCLFVWKQGHLSQCRTGVRFNPTSWGRGLRVLRKNLLCTHEGLLLLSWKLKPNQLHPSVPFECSSRPSTGSLTL